MSDIDDELFALAGGDEEAEEGEASDVASEADSLGSGAMDESDSDRDDDKDDNEPVNPFPLEGKYINAADKAHIESLPQLAREQVLGERADEISRFRFNEELARKAKQRQLEDAQAEKKKRKATSLEPEDSYRKSSRQKTKTSDKLEAYKREREQRGRQRQGFDDRRNNRRRRSDSPDKAGSDVDAEGESEVEWDDQARQPAPEVPASIREFESVRVSRGFFQKVCFYPGFDEAMIGAFARIGTGQDAQRRTLYKMAQIKGFTTGKPYVFEGKGGAKSATDQYVICQHGSVKKEYTFLYLSNQGFTDADFETYKQSCAEANARVPSRSFLEQKYQDIKNLENRTWTDKDIGNKIKRQNQYKHLIAPAASSSVTPVKVDYTAQRLAEINKANRRANSEQIRKALIAERQADLRARKEHEKALILKKKKEEEEKAKTNSLQVPSSDIDNLFEGSDRSRSATPAVRSGTPKPEKKVGIPTFRKKKMDDDIIAAMDMGIDIEI